MSDEKKEKSNKKKNPILPAEEVARQYRAKLQAMKQEFAEEVHQRYHDGVARMQVSLVVATDVEYQWQKDMLDDMFLRSGYELTFITDDADKYTRKRKTRASIIIPGAPDVHLTFQQ